MYKWNETKRIWLQLNQVLKAFKVIRRCGGIRLESSVLFYVARIVDEDRETLESSVTTELRFSIACYV